MKEIFISEKDIPKACCLCDFENGEIGKCQALNKHITGLYIPKICPLKSIKQHDNEVRREFAEKVKNKMQHECFINNESVTDKYIIQRKEFDDLLREYEVEE